MKRKERITWTPSTPTAVSTTRLTSSSTRSAPPAVNENLTSSHDLHSNLEEGTSMHDSNMGSEEGRLVGMIGKIQNLSSSVGFITRTLEGNCLYVIRLLIHHSKMATAWSTGHF